ncbi:MAG TPA: hypothetical protein VJY62_20270 [Bacteroidia bacterium]|nr:hypothetical protein [Bacteroidia bacterium]
MKTIVSSRIMVILSLFLTDCSNSAKQEDNADKIAAPDSVQESDSKFEPTGDSLDVAIMFKSSGWMGDGEQGTQYIKFEGASKENPHSPPTCIKVRYIPGYTQWGGIYWQNKDNNWGDAPGENLTAKHFTAITFYARGNSGGETVEFKAGGIKDKKYKDSFEVTLGKVPLDTNWQEYIISLEGKDLSSVIGGFCWVAAGADNPSGATFFIDDIKYVSK